MKTSRRTFIHMALAAPAILGPTRRGWAQGLPRVRLSGSAPVIRPDHAMRYLGIPMGYYEKLGFQGEYLPTAGSAAGLQLLLAGEVEVAGCGLLEFIKAKTLQPDLPAHFVFSQERTSGYEVVVKEGGPYTAIEQLAGKNIGVPSLASGALPFARALLKKAGVDYNGVNFVPVGVGAQALATLNGGGVDALAMFGGSIAALELLGEKFRIFGAPIAGAGNVMTDRFVRENRDLAVAIYKGLVLNHRIMKSNPEETVRAYWAQYGAVDGKSDDQLRQGVYYIRRTADTFQALDDPRPWGLYTDEEWATTTQFFAGVDDMIPAGAKLSDFFSAELAEEGNKVDAGLIDEAVARFKE